MKNTLQTLLMIFALGLCGLCTWQWYGQVQQRKEQTELAQANYDETVAIRDYTNRIAVLDHQIAQLDTSLMELKEAAKSNSVVIFGLREEKNRLAVGLDQYSNAVVMINAQVKQANDTIRQQNDSIKGLVAERDEYVKRLNESIKDRNEVVGKYNDLVKRVEEIQAGQTKKKEPK